MALKIVNFNKIKTVDPFFLSVKNEVSVLKHLKENKCKYIVNLKCHFEDKEASYLGLEFCPGGELFTLIQRQYDKRGKGLSMEITKYYAACILLALDHLHKLKIIFKDLKSENIVISKDGEPKLTDFGMSKH